MAMEPGGIADKLGNEYERDWVVLQLLKILQNEVGSVTWEARGPDGDGIDIRVILSSGTDLRISCKRENASEGRWPLTALNARGVLKAAKAHITANPNNQFVFVSREHCVELRDLTERAKSYDHNSELYYSNLPANLRRSFLQLGKYWGFDPENVTEDRVNIFNMIQKCKLIAFDVDMMRQHVHAVARATVNADATITRTILADHAVARIGCQINRSELEELLKSKQLSLHPNVTPDQAIKAIQSLQETFNESITPYLINDQLIHRDEAKKLIDLALSNQSDRPKLVIVHGGAGNGKSGVLIELARGLRERNIPYLPIRLDRKVPIHSADKFGREVCGLPASPAHTLELLHYNGRIVLILDQLDALRWTASHTDEALDVATAVIHEAVNQFCTADITVVIVCRTFDYEDDPRISHLKNIVKSTDIPIGNLAPDVVQRIVDNKIWNQLTPAQQLLLQQPQALYLWTKLRASRGCAPVFRTHTDLMFAFWQYIYDKLPLDISTDGLSDVLHQLVNQMDRTGRLTAPLSLIHPSSKHIVQFLQSQSILRIDDCNQCIFTHQSYFDYQVASELNRKILAGDHTLCDWLKGSEQSLFRRDQLRQVLAMQRDDDPVAYIRAIEGILNDEHIRFHFKHMAIRFMAQADPPNHDEVKLVTDLLPDAFWREHLYGLLLWNKPAWFCALDDAGLWRQWIQSGEEDLINMALRIIGYSSRFASERAYSLLSPLITQQDPWPERVSAALTWGEIDNDSRDLFRLRLRMMRMGYHTERHIWWERLAKKYPKRSMAMFAALLRSIIQSGSQLKRDSKLPIDSGEHNSAGENSTKPQPNTIKGFPVFGWGLIVRCAKQLIAWLRNLIPFCRHLKGNSKRHIETRAFEDIGAKDLKSLQKAARRCPTFVWATIANYTTHLERLNRWAKMHRDWTDYNSPIAVFVRQSDDGLKICEKLLVTAGRSLAQQQSLQFKTLIHHFVVQKNIRYVERSLMRSLAGLPDNEADYAIKWLISDHRRFRIGPQYGAQPEEMPARKIITKFVNKCSAQVVTDLEAAIMSYRVPTRIRKIMIKHDHENRMKGYLYPDYYHRSRYILLSAIPRKYLSLTAQGQLGVWTRHYGQLPFEARFRSYGGFVGSTIPTDRLEYITDRQWLAIITGKWPNGAHLSKVMGPGHLGEASHEHFARDIGAITRRQPQRFAKLAMKIPLNAPIEYLYNIIQSLEQKEPPEILTKSKEQNPDNPKRLARLQKELSEWKASPKEEIETIFQRFTDPIDKDVAQAICWVITKRDDIIWSTETVTLVTKLATLHVDPQSGSSCKEEDSDVSLSGMNCVRGSAAHTIMHLLFSQPTLFTDLLPAICHLADDSHVAVRSAAIAVCYPILNIDKDKAVELFIKACSIDDERIFLSYYINDFLRHSFRKYPAQLIPIVERMARSCNEKVAEQGSAWITAAWLYEGWCEESFNRCRSGSLNQQIGVAETLGQATLKNETKGRGLPLLPEYFSSGNKDIRAKMRELFSQDSTWENPNAKDLITSLIKTQTFLDDPTHVIRNLNSLKTPLIPWADTVFAVADQFAGPLAKDAQDIRQGFSFDVPELFKLILRLYQQAQDTRNIEIQAACLDRWDALLLSGVGNYRDMESLLDSTER